MLNIIFGAVFCPDCVMDPRVWFQRNKMPEWFSDPFAQRIIKDIDEADVLFEEALRDRWGHGMPPDYLCSGTKTLLCIYHSPETWFNGNMMGENCVPYLLEMAKTMDIHVQLEYLMKFENDEDFKWILVDGKPVDRYEYEDCFSDYGYWLENYSEEFHYRRSHGEPDLKPVKPYLPRMSIEEVDAMWEKALGIKFDKTK